MGFPPPLVPHVICEPRRPFPTERWDWVVCRNALWVNKLWSAIYPYHAWGQRPQSPPSSCPKARKILHRASAPETGTLAVFYAHRSPEGSSAHNHLMYQSTACSSTSGSCLLPQSLRPEHRLPVHLSGTAHVGPKALLSAPATGHHSNHSHLNRRIVIA
jgi:hypothetical protein